MSRPLWQRALLRSLKVLVRRHPLAALAAVGSGLAYAGREVLRQGVETLRPNGAATQSAPEEVPPRFVPLPAIGTICEVPEEDEQRRQLLDSLSPADRRALADLARQAGRQDSKLLNRHLEGPGGKA